MSRALFMHLVLGSIACGERSPEAPCLQHLYHPDADADGYGSRAVSVARCAPEEGDVRDASDCEDADAAIHPDAEEVVGDERDQDCNGREICFVNGDSDRSRTEDVVPSDDADCADPGEAPASFPIDCDDADASRDPGSREDCTNGRDDGCDGLADFADPDCGSPSVQAGEDGLVVVDGEPFFPIGTVLPWYDEWGLVDWDRTFDELSSAGANFYAHLDAFTWPEEVCTDLFPRAYEAGIRIGIGSYGTWLWNGLDEDGTCTFPIEPPLYDEARLTEILACGRHHPGFIAWMNRDEAIWTYDPRCVPSRHMIAEEDFYDAYERLALEEPRRLVWYNEATAHRARSLEAYVDDASRYSEGGADVVGFDIYPYPYHRPGTFGYDRCVAPALEDRADWCHENLIDDSEPTVVGDFARLWADRIAGGKPLWAILQGYAGIPFEDLRFITYGAIVGGVRGVVYAGHQWDPDGPETWRSATKPMIQELSSIHDLLAAPRLDLGVPDRSTGIDFLARETSDAVAIFAVNRSLSTTRAVFELGDVAVADSVEVLFEDRSIPLEGSRLEDSFGPYGVHVYRLPKRE